MADPYSVTKRKPLTQKQKLKMFLEAGGVCCVCGQRIDGVREAWDEHVDPLWLNGSNDIANRRPAHDRCARVKSAKETTERAKCQRVAEHHLGAKRPSKPMPGSKRSGWKKTFSNGWVRRDQE